MRLRVLAVVVVVALSSSVLSASPAEAAAAARPYDFNGDGYPELVVGAPHLRVGSVGAGGVVVLPASARGLSLRETVISQSSRGVPGASESGDGFGESVASADFDRDGYADVAVGQPGENERAGAVTVIYGSSRGLNTSRSFRINPTSDTGNHPPPEGGFGLYFGLALVAGDFNRDGFPDLAIGAPYADLEGDVGVNPSGSVTVMPGGRTGLSSTDPVVLRGQADGGSDSAFGNVLAAGDIDRDGGTDLIVHAGSRFEEQALLASISYCPGWVGEPTGCRRLVYDRNYAAPASARASLAVGNMSGDALPEIVVGLPNEPDLAPEGDGGGEVRILHLGARPRGVTVVRETQLTQDSRGVPGSQEPSFEDLDGIYSSDEFGSSIALGDIDRDGYADLFIGATGENKGEGRVTVVHGAATGWRTSGNYFYDQDTRGIPGVAERHDRFGSDVYLRDHNRDGRLDLTVSAPYENDSGAITTLRGSGRGFTTTGARTFGLATLGYPHPVGALFGGYTFGGL